MPTTSDKDDLSKLAQGIIDSLSRPYTINGTAVSIGASIGIVTSDYDDRTSDDLMRDADLALYAAKAAGKGCFRFFAPEMHEAARERQLMESDLRVALEKGQLRLVYQPCVDASSEEVTGFEALIRWDHPEHGPVSPAMFIPLAEEIGLINEIGEWVLRTACAEAAKWPQNVSVAVNLSPVQFKSHALPTMVRTVLSETDFPAKRLELEITEGVFLNNDEHVHDMIASLKAIGLKLALDDFGTGYSSLSYLQRVPFDKIKIDQLFRHRRVRPGKPQCGADPGDGRPCLRPSDADHGRGRRDAGRTAACTQSRLLAGPGLHLRQADAAGGGARARQERRRDPARSTASPRTAHADHPRRAAPLPGAGKGRAAAEYLERRRSVECREELPSVRRSSSISPQVA